MRPTSAATPLALCFALAATSAAPQDDADRDALARRLEALGAGALEAGAHGVALALDVGGELVYAGGWGFVDDLHATAADADAIFGAGALLPLFLSVAALRLAEAGELDLDAPLARYVDGLGYDERVRVEQLLAQTSGIPSYADLLEARGELSRAFDPQPILAWLAEAPLAAEPGTCVAYSPTNDFLLGRVLERAAGREVRAQLEELFADAGLARTGWDPGPAVRARATVAQVLGGGSEDVRGAPAPFEAEALGTTALDLVRFQRALDGGELLGGAWLRRLATPARLVEGVAASTAHGLELSRLEDQACREAGGSLGGYAVHLARYPSLDATLVVLASGGDAPVRSLGTSAARALLARARPEPQDFALPEGAERFVGDYYAGCTSYGIALDGDHLVLHPPGGAEHRLLFQGGAEFVLARDPDVRLRFELEDGRAVAFVLEDRGITLRAKRVS